MGAQVSVHNDLDLTASVSVEGDDGVQIDEYSFKFEPNKVHVLDGKGIELGSKYRLFVSYIDKKEASFDVHFKGHKMLVPMTLKLSDIQKQGIDRLLGGSRANQKSNGTASGSRPGTLNGTRELSLPTLESSFEQDKKQASSDYATDSDYVESVIAVDGLGEPETRLPMHAKYEPRADLKKTDRKLHTHMKTRVNEDVKELAAALNKQVDSKVPQVLSKSERKRRQKKRDRDQRREKKWIEMKSYLHKHKKWPKQLKERVRKGVPSSLRGYVWVRLLGVERKMKDHPGLYSKLVKQQKTTNKEKEPFRTIERDLPRTFAENKFLPRDTSNVPAQERLREILYAYANFDKEVMYCQGMNLVAAFLMLSCPYQNEEVFWFLERLCHHREFYLQDLYGGDLRYALEFEFVLKKLLKSFLPKLHKAFKKADKHLGDFLPFGSTNVFAPKWVISLWSFVPPKCAVRIWDIFLNEGHKILYRVALFVLKRLQKEIIQNSNIRAFDGGDYLLALTKLQKASYIGCLDVWKDEDVMIYSMFKFTQGLRNHTILKYRKAFWKEKQKAQLEMEIKENQRS